MEAIVISRKAGILRMQKSACLLMLICLLSLSVAACSDSDEGAGRIAEGRTAGGTGLPVSVSSQLPVDSNAASSPGMKAKTLPMVPVIIIPGIAGSELTAPQKSTAGESGRSGILGDSPSNPLNLLWPPIDNDAGEMENVTNLGSLLILADLSMRRLDQLAYPSASSMEIVPLKYSSSAPSKTRRIGTGDIYRKLYESIAARRGNGKTYFFGYDWRQDNLTTARNLERYISEIESQTGMAQVDIVAHSMGGLVVSAYLARPGAGKNVRRIVVAGSPLHGAGEAFQSLDLNRRGESILGTSGIFGGVLGGLHPVSDSGPGRISLGLQLKLWQLITTYPSVYELLSPQDFARLSELGLPQCAFSPKDAAAAIEKARAYNREVTVGLASIWKNIDVLFLVGEGKRTLDSGQRYIDGDGTVSVMSAEDDGAFSRRSLRISADHVGLISGDEAISRILDYLQ